jgi:PAS domain S-box-containing protein
VSVLRGRRPPMLALTSASFVAIVMFAVALAYSSLHVGLAVAAATVFTALVLIQLLLVVVWWRRGIRDNAAMEHVQRQLMATSATSGGWVYVIDPGGRFVYSSEASREFLGYEPHELLGREARSLLSPMDVPHVDSRVGDLPHHVNVVVVRGRHRDGQDLWLEVTIAPVLGVDNSDILGYGGTARLVTDGRHPVILREIHRREATELLRTEQLVIAFQPIIDLTSGRVLGVEALSRFPSRPETTPDVVFAGALDAGLGIELELLAVRRAMLEARLLDPSLYVAVNASPAVLANPALTDALQAGGIDLHRIVVEVTEHASVTDYTKLARARQRLRDLGVRLAIDDAGAGYASLRHIVTLAPDIIKIDRALIADLDSDRARRALVMAIVMYAMEIGTTVVVGEGVETPEELDALKSLGADAAQGFLLGRPTTSPADWSAWGASASSVSP